MREIFVCKSGFIKLFTLVFVFLFSSFAFGDDSRILDSKAAKASWTAYKFYDKTPVSGTFKDVKYEWGKGKNITGLLTNAKATINTLSVDLGDETKNENVRDNFFKTFKKQEIIVKIDKVEPDSNDKNKGKLVGIVEINGIKKPIWMPYNIANNAFVASGVIDFYDFNLNAPLEKLKKACEYMHEGKTWAEASFKLEMPIK